MTRTSATKRLAQLAKQEPSADLATQINQEHEAAITDAKSAINHALACGRLLVKAKDAAGHGNWLDWLTAHVPEISERTVQRYMRLAERWPSIEAYAQAEQKAIEDLSMGEALDHLANKADRCVAEYTAHVQSRLPAAEPPDVTPPTEAQTQATEPPVTDAILVDDDAEANPTGMTDSAKAHHGRRRNHPKRVDPVEFWLGDSLNIIDREGDALVMYWLRLRQKDDDKAAEVAEQFKADLQEIIDGLDRAIYHIEDHDNDMNEEQNAETDDETDESVV